MILPSIRSGRILSPFGVMQQYSRGDDVPIGSFLAGDMFRQAVNPEHMVKAMHGILPGVPAPCALDG